MCAPPAPGPVLGRPDQRSRPTVAPEGLVDPELLELAAAAPGSAVDASPHRAVVDADEDGEGRTSAQPVAARVAAMTRSSRDSDVALVGTVLDGQCPPGWVVQETGLDSVATHWRTSVVLPQPAVALEPGWSRIVIAVLLDVSHWAASASQLNQIPGRRPGAWPRRTPGSTRSSTRGGRRPRPPRPGVAGEPAASRPARSSSWPASPSTSRTACSRRWPRYELPSAAEFLAGRITSVI